jgi:hypothetical protein
MFPGENLKINQKIVLNKDHHFVVSF